jgi:hypothetical protein
MHCVLERHSADTVRKYIAAVTVYNTVDTGKPFIDFAVDVPLQVARFRVLLYRFRRFHIILYKIVWRAYQRGRHVAWHPECPRVVWRSHRDVAVRVEDAMVMEDV